MVNGFDVIEVIHVHVVFQLMSATLIKLTQTVKYFVTCDIKDMFDKVSEKVVSMFCGS